MSKLNKNNDKIILISGPTASGKSNIALKLAKKINGEIVNADSMQVYKEISVLSSKPTLKEMTKVKHHLYDIKSVKNEFSTGEWVKLAKKTIDKIILKKKCPIIVGGTGLYFRAIEKGLSKIPKIKKDVREFSRELQKKIGQKNFYKRLIKIDPKCKNKFSPTDTQRSIRAFEVINSTKKSLYDWTRNTKTIFSEYDIKKIYIDIPRDNLLKNINKRTELIINSKSIDEVKNFLKINIDKSLPANKIIGLREIELFLRKSLNLEEIKNLINIKTRQYAKRQRTWSRAYMTNWNMVYNKDLSILLKKILKDVS